MVEDEEEEVITGAGDNAELDDTARRRCMIGKARGPTEVNVSIRSEESKNEATSASGICDLYRCLSIVSNTFTRPQCPLVREKRSSEMEGVMNRD